jgi:glycine/D-amino acid oxidase-like deaminating enzyme
LYDRLDAPYEVLDPTEVRRRWPVLSPPNDCIALHDPRGGYSEPSELVPALLRQARELGVEICEGEPVHEFILHGERVTGVRTSVRSLKADHVVSTVHVWSLPLWRETGYRVPIKHFVHQRYLSRPMSQPFESPPVNADPFCGYVRPADGNRILMGVETPDREEYRVKDLAFDMNEVCVTDEVREAGRNRLSQLVPSLSDVEWESQRVGLISFSYDGEPILGPVQRIPGLYVAASFHSGGYSYSAVAGRLMAEFVTDGNASMDISAFSPDRFDTAVTQNHLSETIAQRCAIRRRH